MYHEWTRIGSALMLMILLGTACRAPEPRGTGPGETGPGETAPGEPGPDAGSSNTQETQRPAQNSARNTARTVTASQGVIHLRDDQMMFLECGQPEGMAYRIDSPSALVLSMYAESRSVRASDTPVFASVFLEAVFDSAGGRAARIDRINYWPIEGFGCDYPWGEFGLRGFGNEPFWMLNISGGVASLNRPGLGQRSWEIETNRIPVISTDGVLRVDAEEAPCRDSMSGTLFGTRITIHTEEGAQTGCGMRGMGSLFPLG